MNRKIQIFFCIFILSVVVSCGTSKKIVYLQDAGDGTSEKIEPNVGIVIQPKDMLSIVVSSKDMELAMPFNLATASYQMGNGGGGASVGGSQRLLGYVVDNNGFIDFPILGKLKISGLTRWQLADTIKQRLIDEEFLKDPIITIQFMNFTVSVMGEVSSPNQYNIESDKITLLEVLSRAGDLTIHGKRDNVKVIREKDGIINTYSVDLRSRNLFKSPVYYLQQNDIVYVEPSKVRAGQSRINENSFRSVSMWMSIISFLTTLTILFIK